MFFETGLSDLHKLTFTVLKTYFQKQKPKVIKYRSYKFNNNCLEMIFRTRVKLAAGGQPPPAAKNIISKL